ncbi:MAG: polyprenyl synthetase family protein [Gemmatimonadota bacterium]
MISAPRPAGPAGTALADPSRRRFRRMLSEFRERLEAELESFFRSKRAGLPGGSRAAELVDGVGRLVQGGGKRLRPALVYHTYRGCGGASEAAVLPLAVSIELLHTYLLIHDDIMDHSALRRGQPSAHEEFRRRHERCAWPGDSADFGRSMAILLGDLAYTWAVEQYQLARRGTAGRASSDELQRKLDGAFSRTCEEVIAGQYLEMHLPVRDRPDEEELLQVLRLKSGRYSVERPMELGALLGGASQERLAALREYGENVGEVFQLQDDILGVFGEAEALGKPVGSDLREGKFTFLIHETLRQTSSAESRKLRGMLGREGLTPAEVEEARAIIRRSGGLAAVQAMIDARLGAAREALDNLSFEPDAFSFFTGLIAYSRDRDR